MTGKKNILPTKGTQLSGQEDKVEKVLQKVSVLLFSLYSMKKRPPLLLHQSIDSQLNFLRKLNRKLWDSQKTKLKEDHHCIK